MISSRCILIMTMPKDLRDPNQIDICENVASAQFPHLKPCCLSRGHKDRCRFWTQKLGEIRTWEIEGNIKHGLHLKNVQLLKIDDELSYEEVAALVQYLDWVRDRKSD